MAATVARYIAWQGLRGTVKEASMQPYLSAINGFYRDHGAEPVAQGDLIISKVRKGRAAPKVEPDPPGVRTDVPARLITRTLRLAETLREELGPTWTRDQFPRILLFRTAMAVVAIMMMVVLVVVAVVMVEAAEAAEVAALGEVAVEPLAVTRVAVVESTHRP
eukprot:jgi/Tetstr1/440102/TSEL_028460.t1